MCGDVCNSKGGCGCSSGGVSVEQPFAREVEVLRFLKEPVRRLSDLYDRYPDGGEWGWCSFVVDKGAFAYWSPEEKEWRLMSNENPEQLLRLINHRFRGGDTFVWNTEKERFELVNLPETLKKHREEILKKVEDVRKVLNGKIDQQGRELDEKITQQGKDLDSKIEQKGRELGQKINQQGKKLGEKITQQGKEFEKKITEQGKTLVGSINQLKKRLDAPYLEACTDYCSMSGMGGEFRTRVISTASGKDVDWVIDDRMPLPDWLEAKRVGDELVVNVKEYVML